MGYLRKYLRQFANKQTLGFTCPICDKSFKTSEYTIADRDLIKVRCNTCRTFFTQEMNNNGSSDRKRVDETPNNNE